MLREGQARRIGEGRDRLYAATRGSCSQAQVSSGDRRVDSILKKCSWLVVEDRIVVDWEENGRVLSVVPLIEGERMFQNSRTGSCLCLVRLSLNRDQGQCDLGLEGPNRE